jgi:hypothetical protein
LQFPSICKLKSGRGLENVRGSALWAEWQEKLRIYLVVAAIQSVGRVAQSV